MMKRTLTWRNVHALPGKLPATLPLSATDNPPQGLMFHGPASFWKCLCTAHEASKSTADSPSPAACQTHGNNNATAIARIAQ